VDQPAARMLAFPQETPRTVARGARVGHSHELKEQAGLVVAWDAHLHSALECLCLIGIRSRDVERDVWWTPLSRQISGLS
jgi:hypothetical protein